MKFRLSAQTNVMPTTPANQCLPKRTGINLVKSLLKTLASLSNNLPVPGLKPASELLLKLIEGIQETEENVKVFQDLSERLERLNGLLQAPQSNMSKTRPFLERLETELSNIRVNFKDASTQGRLVRFLNSTDNSSSIAKHLASLDSIIIDYMAAIASQTLHLVTEVHEKLDKSSNNHAKPKGGMTSRLRMECYAKGRWQEIDSDTCTFSASFAHDPTKSTTFQLTVVSSELVQWTIYTPASFWYPGAHSGTLELSRDYPFKRPQLRIETPIFSPNVNRNGHISVDILWDLWSPSWTIKEILDVVAFMLVIDPVCTAPSDERLPGIPLNFHHLSSGISRYLEARGEEGFVRAANFFARAYAQAELQLITDPPVTPAELEMSVVVIKELLEYFFGKTQLDDPPEGSTSNDPTVAFKELQHLSDWRLEEQRWAKAMRCMVLKAA